MAKPLSAQSRIAHLLKHWPADPVRPASVSVQAYLQSRLSPVVSDTTTTQTQTQTQPNSVQPQSLVSQNTATISESSLNALSSLLEDRYARRYPLSPKLRRPASNPDHYDNVIREFEEAPTRDWVGRLGKRLKGLFRFT